MYEKDKKVRITVRLSEEQFAVVKGHSTLLGVSPSDYIRMLVNAVMYQQRMDNSPEGRIIKEACGRENDESPIDH